MLHSSCTTLQVAVGLALGVVYILMQTFAIPGTAVISLLSGAVYGRTGGFAFIALISTFGSTSCFALSWAVGRPLVHAIWPEKLEFFEKEVKKYRSDMFAYMIFLRVTPILPNIFINVASPIVGVPLHIFFLGENALVPVLWGGPHTSTS